MNEQKQAGVIKVFRPILIVFILVSVFPVVFSKTLEKIHVDQAVLIIGNIILFAVTLLSFLLYRKAMIAGNTQGFIKNVYSGMLLKFFVCIIAAFIYIFNARQAVNKGGVFALMFLYLVYTFLEISILMKNSKHKKNA
ncbi:MAG: hypothetical protein ABIN89_07565 [Chitinophagaceae bacterium]